jgi:MSHA biogenesis protein MshQ
MTVTGAVSITLGWISVGNATGSQLILNNGASLTVNSGRLDVSGGLDSAATNSTGTITMAGGSVYLQTLGAGTPTSLMLGSGTTFSMSGGTIALINGDNTTYDLDIRSAAGSITGGTLQIGDTGTPYTISSANQFAITDGTPGNLALPNLTLAASVARSTTLSLTNPITIAGNLSINANNSFLFTSNANAVTVGGSVTNAGTYTSSNNSLSVTGSIGNTGTFTAGSSAISVGGNWSNGGSFTQGTSTVTFTGNTNTTLGGATATTFNNLIMNKPAVSGLNSTITVNTTPTVNGTLTFTNGNIVTGANKVILGTAATIATPSPSSYVVGSFQKNYLANANLSYFAGNDFPVGDASNFTPVNVSAGTTTTAGSLTVATTAAQQPQVATPIASTGIDAANDIARYWTFTAAGLTSGATAIAATFNFVASDVVGAASPASYIAERYDGTNWNPTTLVAAGATSTLVSGLYPVSAALPAASNDFAIGALLAGFTAVPGRFNAFETATPANAILGKIQTKKAGVAFGIDIVSINAAKTGYGGAVNPVTVELRDSSAGGALDVNGCNTAAWPLIQTVTSALSIPASGRVTLSAITVAQSYRSVRARITGGGNIGCSTDLFAIRPQSLTISGLDATWQTAGTGRALNNIAATGGSGIVHAASELAAATPRPFTLNVAPVPATATNYDGIPTVVAGFPVCCTPSTAPACGTLPATCGAGTLTVNAASWTAAGSGMRQNATANYAEAGVANVQLEDQNYADVDAVDGTPLATRTIPATATAQIGRFVPDHFVFASPSTPQFQTFGAADGSCQAPVTGAKRSFTYIGQPFWYVTLPSATVQAVGANGTVTSNYRGALFKLTAAGFTESYSNNAIGPALDPSAIGTAALTGTGNGTATYTAAAGGLLAYQRSTAAAIPASSSPFSANLSLTATATDASETGAGNPGTSGLTGSTTFSSIVFDGGTFLPASIAGGTAFVYGRLRMFGATGVLNLALPVAAQTEYWTGTGFTLNPADNCTTLARPNIALGSYANNLAACETFAGTSPATFASGAGLIVLTAPGAGNNGSVLLTPQLGTTPSGSYCTATGGSGLQASATSAARNYLQGAWGGVTTYDQNPTARAAFGIYGAQPRNFIFTRENY